MDGYIFFFEILLDIQKPSLECQRPSQHKHGT